MKYNEYLVSTTTHRETGEQIDAWEGDYASATSKEETIADATKWEASLLKEDGATNIEIVENTVFYENDGEKFYKEIHVDIQ